MKSLFSKIVDTRAKFLSALFYPQEERAYRWLTYVWLGLLYLGGAFLYTRFLNSGHIPFEFEDWAEVTAPRLAFLKDAIIKGVLPLHMPDTSALRGLTDRYLTIPDLILSPQVLLLGFMDVGPFVLANTLLLYTAGISALLWIRRKYNLSLLSFSVLFLLFNFNGHILSHLSIGHANWAGYFLFPWLAIQTLRLLENRRDWVWVTQTALLLFLLYLQGSFHQFVWWLLFFGILAVVDFKHSFIPLLKTMTFALLLSMMRIIPSALEYGGYGNDNLGGYVSLSHLVQAMITWKAPWEARELALPFTTLSWWEYDLYIGLLGALFVAFFGIWQWVKNREGKQAYFILCIPILVMTALSIGKWLGWIRHIPIPLLAGERVASRLISLPFVFLLIFATIQLQHWLNQKKSSPLMQLGMLGLVGVLFQDLLFYLLVWRVDNVAPNLPQASVDLSIKVVANHPDPVYTTSLLAGAIISVISLLILFFLAFRSQKSPEI